MSGHRALLLGRSVPRAGSDADPDLLMMESPRLEARAIRTTTRWPRRSTHCSRPNWSATADHERTSTTSRSPSPSTSTGSTIAGSTARSASSHRSSTRPLTAEPPSPSNLLSGSSKPPSNPVLDNHPSRAAVSRWAFPRSVQPQQTRLASPSCRTPPGQSAGARQAHPGNNLKPRFRCHVVNHLDTSTAIHSRSPSWSPPDASTTPSPHRSPPQPHDQRSMRRPDQLTPPPCASWNTSSPS